MNFRTNCRRRVGATRRLAGRLLAGVTLVACAASACSWAGDAEISPSETFASASGRVVLDIDLLDDRTWTASGPLAEVGAICARGTRHHLEWYDADTGERISAAERRDRLKEALHDRREADIIDVWENTCHDGSGSITTEEARAQGTWTVLTGTGAYLNVAGSGTLRLQHNEHGAVDSLYVVAEIAL